MSLETRGMPAKKIVYVITKSNFGGAQKYVFELAMAAKEHHLESVVIFGGTGEKGSEPGLLERKLKEVGIRTICIPTMLRNMSPLDDLRSTWSLWKAVRLERPDVLHVTSSKAGGIGAFVGRLARVPRIVFTSHGLTFDESWRPRWQRAGIWILTWFTIAFSHVSIMISSETFRKALSMPLVGEKVVLIYNGVKLPPLLSRTQARAILKSNWPTEGLWVGGIGELHPNKNWQFLIGAFTKLPPELKLVIIGEGEERERLTDFIYQHNLTERVHLAGFIPNAASLLPALDIFVLPSKKEGLPYVLLEAGLANCSIIASDISGNRDIITHKETGLLVPHTVSALTNAITALANNEAQRTRYTQALQAHVASTFSQEKMIADTFLEYRLSTTR